MKTIHFNSAAEVLDFAIAREEEARDFYLEWEEKVAKPHLREVLTEFASEEEKHKEILLNVKTGSPFTGTPGGPVDLKIGDYFTSPEASVEMTYQHALQIAIKREIGAQELYKYLSGISHNKDYEILFDSLYQEESKHKLRLEIIYDDEFMREN